MIVTDHPVDPLAYVLVPHGAHEQTAQRLVPHIGEGELKARVEAVDCQRSDVARRQHLQPVELIELPSRRRCRRLAGLEVCEGNSTGRVTDAAEHGTRGYRGAADTV